MLRTKRNVVRGDFDEPVNTDGVWWDILKLFRFMSVMMVRTKCKLNNTELFLKLFHIQCKEIGNKKYYEEAIELEKW